MKSTECSGRTPSGTDLEDWDEPELHVKRSGVAPDHVGDLRAHVDGEGLGAGGEARGREDGRVHLHVVVGLQGVSDVVVHLVVENFGYILL